MADEIDRIDPGAAKGHAQTGQGKFEESNDGSYREALRGRAEFQGI